MKSCDKAQNKKIKEDYSNPASEMGHFKSSYDGGVHARDFTVRNGVGYLTLDDGDVIKLKRVGEGRYSGLNYEAVQTAGGYNPILPNIHCFEDIVFTEDDLKSRVLQDCLRSVPVEASSILHDLQMFEDASSYGTLMRPRLTVRDIESIRKYLANQNRIEQDDSLFAQSLISRILNVLAQEKWLLDRYHVVIDNPPYLGAGNMDPKMSAWLKENYVDVKSDLFAAFIVRNTELTIEGGHLGFMSPFVWMFISSYEKLRRFIIDTKTITSLVQLEYSGFAGATVPICTFTLENLHRSGYRGGYVRLSDFKGADIQGPKALEIIKEAKSAMKGAS